MRSQVPFLEEENSVDPYIFAYKESSGQVSLLFLGLSLSDEENIDRVRYISFDHLQ